MFRCTAFGVFLALIATPMAAQNLIDATDERLIASFLQDEGFRAKIEIEDDGDPTIKSTSSGTNFYIYFHECTKGTDCQSIRFFVAFDLPNGLPLAQADEFNAEIRYGKVYLDKERDPIVEMDVNLRHGLTRENLSDTLEIWLQVMGDFEKFLDKRDRG